MFSNATSLKKIENSPKRALRLLYSNYQLSYEELLDKANSSVIMLRDFAFMCGNL